MTQAVVIEQPGAVCVVDVAGGSLELVAAELLPFDRQVAGGRVPSVTVDGLRAGQVAVARRADGVLVSVEGGRAGLGLGAPQGTFAQAFDAPDEVQCALPAGLDPYVAAAGCSAALSARLALQLAQAAAGDTVLVVGAQGAVGAAAAEIAQSWGLEVRRLTRDGAEPGPAATVVIDLVGGPTLAEVIALGAPRCRHVLVGNAGDAVVPFVLPSLLVREHQLLGFNAYRADLADFQDAHAAALLDLRDRVVTVPAERLGTVPLARAADAYQGAERPLLVP